MIITWREVGWACRMWKTLQKQINNLLNYCTWCVRPCGIMLQQHTTSFSRDFKVVLKQTTLGFAVDNGSSGYVMFQDWAFTVPEEHGHLFSSRVSCTGTSLVSARKNVTTPYSFASPLPESNIPNIRLQWLYIVEISSLLLWIFVHSHMLVKGPPYNTPTLTCWNSTCNPKWHTSNTRFICPSLL